MQAYRVTDWNQHFENNRSREIKRPRYFLCPNRYDNDGYIQLISHPKGPEHFAVWITCLGVASRSKIRGTLLSDNGIPHTPATLSHKTRIDVAHYCDGLERDRKSVV